MYFTIAWDLYRITHVFMTFIMMRISFENTPHCTVLCHIGVTMNSLPILRYSN